MCRSHFLADVGLLKVRFCINDIPNDPMRNKIGRSECFGVCVCSYIL